MKSFSRKLRLMEFYADKPGHNDFSLVKPNSEFTPKRNSDIILDTYCDYLTKLPFNEILQDQKKTNKNLSREEWNAIMELKSQDDIIIKQSDKGGACVIMDKTYYYEKMMELLNDRETYQEINSNLDKQTHSKIKTLTERYKHVLTEKECKYLTDFDYQDNNLYGLPKVHKSEEIIKEIKKTKREYLTIHRPKDLKFRLICAGPKGVTSRLSNFVDILLKPFIKHVKSHIRDDIDFLNKLKTGTNEKKVLATFDISSVYTNLDNYLGWEGINFWLEKDPDGLPRNILKEFVLDALGIVLE